MKRLVVLRPEPGATQTAGRAAVLGLDSIKMPLFEVHAVPWIAPPAGEFGGVLLTSSNAIRHAGPRLADFLGLTVFAVGPATAAAARGAGFTQVITGPGTVEALLAAISPSLPLLHLAGRDHHSPRQDRIAIERRVVYSSDMLQQPDDFAAVEHSVVAVHSPRAGRRLSELADHAPINRATVKLAAISSAAADAAGSGWREVGVASEPSEQALLALAARLCEDAQP